MKEHVRIALEHMRKLRNGKPKSHVADEWPEEMQGDVYGEVEHEQPPPDQPGDACEGQVARAEHRIQLKTYTLAELVQTFPSMRESVIHGLLRVGETMNIIAPTKIGKSWLAANLAFAVATGRDWLGFNTCSGDVLIIDNELHPETLASRLRRVADAKAIPLADVAEHITILPLRGKLQNLLSLGSYFRDQIPGRFRLVIIDAYYRTLPPNLDENDNAAVAGLYNIIDQYADHLRGSFVLIHHASKGNQSAKSVTDVGSGAGSQSRAADTHLILRPHQEQDVVVLDAAVRSFPPVNPRCLRWSFPRFTPADELDPADLAETASRRRRKPDPALEKPAEPVWDAKRFAETFGTAEPRPRSVVLDDARQAGLSDRLAEKLLQAAVDRELLFTQRAPVRGRKELVSNVGFQEQTGGS
jgi:hypothetical protein